MHRLQITTLQSLNDALGPINMHVTVVEEGPLASVEWAVRDGRSLFRFHDHMVCGAVAGFGDWKGSRAVHDDRSLSSMHRTHGTYVTYGTVIEFPVRRTTHFESNLKD